MDKKSSLTAVQMPIKALIGLLIILVALTFPGSALADPASFFDTDLATGIDRFKQVVEDANGGTAVFYERTFSSSMSTNVFEVSNGAGGSAWVRVTQNGIGVNFDSAHGTTGTYFHTWSVSVSSWAEAYAEGITFEFFADSGLTIPFYTNAFGLYTFDWGTCCVGTNYTPTGTQTGTAIYSIFDADPTTYHELIGNITQTIPSSTHFVAEIDDREETFTKVTVIPNGNGEFFGVGGYIIFSQVGEDSVPPGSGSTPSIPPGNPDLTAATDLGISNTDNLTSDTTPDFQVTYSPQNDIDFINLYSGPTSSGPWTLIATSPAAGTTSETTVTLTSSTLAGGNYYIAARVENGYWHDESDPSPSPLYVRIDTTPPTLAITAAEVSDGETSNDPSLSLTFTSSESTTSFAAGDVIVTNGSLSGFSGSGTIYTATLTPAADGPVTVNVPAASYTDNAGNNNLAADEFNWTSDQTPPTVEFNPANGETIVANSADIILTLSEAIRRASDNADLTDANIDAHITLKYDDATGLDIPFDATINSANQVITINPDNPLPSNQAVYVAIGTSVEDFANNPLANDSATFMSADETHPTLSSSSPSDGLTGVDVDTDLLLNFSEPVFGQPGGTIEIRRFSDNWLFESISVTGGQISGDGTANITVNITGPLESLTDYYVLISATSYEDADGNPYGGINSPSKLNFTTEYVDQTPPVVTISPTDGATDVLVNANITISFDEAVRHLDDSPITDSDVDALITLKDSDAGGADIPFDATIDAGKQLITINPTSNFNSSQVVYVAIGASVEDVNPPILLATSPVDDSISVGISDDLVLTFNEPVVIGFGTIKIYRSSDNSIFESMSVTSPAQVSGGGTDTINVNPSNTMAYNTSYYVQIDSTAFADAVGNSYAGINDSTSWNFTTEVPDVLPPVVTINPADGTVDVAVGANVTISFDEAVRHLDDSPITDSDVDALITLKDSDAGGADIPFDATIDAGKQLITINPTSNFNSSQVVYVAIGASVEDASDNAILPVNATFTVEDVIAPTLILTSPVDDSVTVGLSDNLVLTFSEPVNVSIGMIIIFRSSDNSVFESIDVTSPAQVSGGGTDSIVVDPSSPFVSSTTYYIQIDNTAFVDAAGNPYAGINDSTSWNFRTEGDLDGDGILDHIEGGGDRDNDGVPNDIDYDPTGYFYVLGTGEIISGGQVSVSGPGAISMYESGASGYYRFTTDGTPGTYTLTVTLPPGYRWSSTCVQSDPPAYDPTGNPNPDMLGAGENGNTGFLTSSACTAFYLTLDLTAGDPFIINNNLPLQARPLSGTGFAPGQITELGEQSADKSYHMLSGGLRLSIPKLGLNTSLVGVPAVGGEWDVTWLGSQAGYLIGTAFPTWPGNTVITGHVWNADDSPGVFLQLKTLQYGDQIQIYAWGEVYTYQVQSNRLVSPFAPQAVLGHKEGDWVTLFTCEDYGKYWGDYGYRRMVQAYLTHVSPVD